MNLSTIPGTLAVEGVPTDSGPVAGSSVRPRLTSARIAGLSLLAMAALAPYGTVVVLQGLVTPGNAAATTDAIAGSVGTFRLGVAALGLVAALDVVIAVALYRVFAPVSVIGSRIEAWLRVAYAAVYAVAISRLVGVPGLLNREDSPTEQVQAQVLQRVEAFHDIWMGALLLFAGHLMVLGYLAYRSRFLPRFLAILLFVAGLGYAYDTVAGLLVEGRPFPVSTVTFVGEFLLAVWLVVRGRGAVTR
ncbi:MAG TPA: DUF4386 domain-containing protein [Jatrophihabitans sp.]